MRGEIEFNRGIFQEDSLSPLLFVASMIPLRLLLGKTKYRYYLKGKQVNHLLYMNDLKLYAKSKKRFGMLVNPVRVFSANNRDGLWGDKICKVGCT